MQAYRLAAYWCGFAPRPDNCSGRCPASNSMGRVVGPLIPVSGFQGAGPVRRALGMRRVMTVKRFGQFDSREVRSEAVVHAAAEGQHGWWGVTGDVEAIGIVVDGGVAVGRGGIDDDQRPGRDGGPAQCDVVDGTV